MRIGALAKKIKVNPSSILTYCETQEISIPNGVNTKLEEEKIRRILTAFAPDQLDDFFIADLPPSTTEKEDQLEKEFLISAVREVEPDQLNEDKVEDQEPEPSEIKSEEPEKGEEDVEVIRAPKIVLEGLKVKGKIELPEPKEKLKKEEKVTDKKEDKRKKNTPKNRGNNKKDNVNPLAEERKRKAREEERRRQAIQRKKKEARAKHYAKIHQEVAKPKKLSDEPIESQVQPEKVTHPAKQNLLQRFWKWFNT